MCELKLETDAVSEDELDEWAGAHKTCNGFAFWYLENVNENAVVKDAIVGNIEHCFVFDPDRNVTIDATLGQFDGKFGFDIAVAAAWDGDEHPHTNDSDEVFEWTDRAAFEDHYSTHPNGPFIL